MSIEIKEVHMNAKLKHKINVRIHAALKPTYFDTIQLATCINILEEFGFTIIQEDYTRWDGFICGREGQEYFTIAMNDLSEYCCKVVKNAQLALSWYKMESGRYEVIGYVA
jgi:hypothetical protein